MGERYIDPDGSVWEVVDDGPRALEMIEKRAFLIHGGCADDRVIDFELFDETDSRLADNRAIRAADGPAGNDDLDFGVGIEQRRDIHIIGDDEQIIVARQGFCDFLGGRADIDEEGGTARDEGGGGHTDGLLFNMGDEAPCIIGDIIDAGRDNGTAMDAA